MATLMAVAMMARRMMNLEKVFCRLKAIRLAMNTDTFNRHIFGILQMYLFKRNDRGQHDKI